MTRLLLDPTRLRPARLTPPDSKSDAVRALAVAYVRGLAPPCLRGPRSDDVRTFQQGLTALAEPGPASIDCGDGGAPFRLLLALSALRAGACALRGSRRLGQRPHAPLFHALLGALGSSGLRLKQGRPWPVRVEGATSRAAKASFVVDARLSSQFASALLLAAAALAGREERPWSVRLSARPASDGYLRLTEQWLEWSGVEVKRRGALLVVRPGPARPLPPVPPDWSSASYLVLVAWRAGGEVAPLSSSASHPDQAIVSLLRQVGLTVRLVSGRARVTGTPRRGLDTRVDGFPDLAPTLAALSCVLPGPTRLRRVATLRLKESDRVRGVCRLVRAFGGKSSVHGDAVVLHPPPRPRPAVFDARGDHRLALAAATAAVLLGVPLRLSGADCVSKSFPGFFAELARAGCRTSE